MRGQTTMDFAVGVSVFVLVTVFVLTFSTGIVQPFSDTGQENTVVADRIADTLVGGMLGDPDRPYLLDKECTIAFFESKPDRGGDDEENRNNNGIYSIGTDCNFRDVELEQRLGVEGRPAGTGPNVNVSLVGDVNDVDGGSDDEVEILCIDENSNNRIIDSGDPRDDSDGEQCDLTGGDDDVLLAIGDEPPKDASSVVVSRRSVSISDVDATLLVRVW